MNEFILFNIFEITVCYKLITIYYKVHFALSSILGANNNFKVPFNMSMEVILDFKKEICLSR